MFLSNGIAINMGFLPTSIYPTLRPDITVIETRNPVLLTKARRGNHTYITNTCMNACRQYMHGKRGNMNRALLWQL